MVIQKGVNKMAENRGKQFETKIKEAFEKVPNTSVTRLHDQTTMYVGSTNHCDFIVYNYPYEYHIECKSIHGNTLSIHSNPKPDRNGVLHGFYGNITDKQWDGLLEHNSNFGVIAGVLVWFIDHDVTAFFPIKLLETVRNEGAKSVRYDMANTNNLIINIPGNKKRIFFDYDMAPFFNECKGRYVGGVR